MKKRLVTAFLAAAVLLLCGSAASRAISYFDVPSEHWSAADVSKASEYGLMEGYGSGIFGLGDNLNRASFVTMLGRMFAWDPAVPASASYADCAPGSWYYSAVETARSVGVAGADPTFRPMDPITRSEMAVMLVKALGYGTLAQTAASVDSPFSDVAENSGYITLAYDIGMTNGVRADGGTLEFLPDAYARREEAAAMLVRVYERYESRISWLHGFYAFSSYSQIDKSDDLDAVSVGWSRISVDGTAGPWLNTSSANNNEWSLPDQSELARSYFRGNGTPCNLNVYASAMDRVTLQNGTVTSTAAAALGTAEARTRTAEALAAAASDYAGITVDFEGLKDPLRDAFTSFMTELRAALPSSKTLYVCVQPDTWFDGYDYRALGELCDKVILMAHDYQWSSIPSYYLGTANTACPVTPFPQIYLALRAITDPDTGVQDRSRLALAISFSSTGFKVDSQGKLLSLSFYNPNPATIITRLRQAGTVFDYSETYRNPDIYYTTEDGCRYRLWYEDERSVSDKIKLAEMFGITGISLWRLGNVPDYGDPGLYYDVWDEILSLSAKQAD